MVFYGLRTTKSKIFRSRKSPTRLHAPPDRSPQRTRASIRSHASDFLQACRRATRALSNVTSWMMSSPTLLTRWSRFDLDRPGLTRIQTACQKKKKFLRENTLTKWTFDHDQKIKIFKTDLSHSIFRVHSDFGTHFFIRGSKIVQTSNFQKS